MPRGHVSMIFFHARSLKTEDLTGQVEDGRSIVESRHAERNVRLGGVGVHQGVPPQIAGPEGRAADRVPVGLRVL